MGRPRRAPEDYARRGPVREPYDYVLIVCEGKKTEPNYFNGLKLKHRLSNANIIVKKPGGNDPISIVEAAEFELRGEPYDHAFCVFDRDGHANYNEALRKVASSDHGKSGRLQAITSVPCFEVWVLLHFHYSTAPFNASGRQSACDKVLAELKKSFPDYSKGHLDTFNRLAAHMGRAITHACRLEAHNREANSDNPSTGMHRLVEYLCGLKDSPPLGSAGR